MILNKELILSKLLEQEEVLTSKQSKISLPILIRICKKMEHNLKFQPIWVSSNNTIIEGHHRYLGSILTGYNLDYIPDYPMPKSTNLITWNEVEFVEDDWDTPYKIKMLNEEDPKYNGLTVLEVEEIIS